MLFLCRYNQQPVSKGPRAFAFNLLELELSMCKHVLIATEPPARIKPSTAQDRRSIVDYPITTTERSRRSRKVLPIAAGVALVATAVALLNRWLAQKAELRNPPMGQFTTVAGVRLHYVDRGTGTPLVLLH